MRHLGKETHTHKHKKVWKKKDCKCLVSSEHFCHRGVTHRDEKLTVTAVYEFEQKDNVICRRLFAKITFPNAAL